MTEEEPDDDLMEVVSLALAGRIAANVSEEAFGEVELTTDAEARKRRIVRLNAFGQLALPAHRTSERDALAESLHSAIFPDALPGSKRDDHNRRDCRQLATHKLIGRDVFLTRDERLLQDAAVAAQQGTEVLGPKMCSSHTSGSRTRSASNGEEPGDFYRSEREALVEGVFDRVIDIPRARDRIALANARERDDEALDDIRYDLRSMIAAVAGAVDGIAVIAQIAFPFAVSDPSRVSLRDREFKKHLKVLGVHRLAKAAGELMPFLRFLWELRNPIFHRHGLPGYTLHQLPGGRLSQITLSATQVDLLDKCCAGRKETAEDWGLRNRDLGGFDPSVDPWPFTTHLAAAGIGAIRHLSSSLVEDAGVEEFEIPRVAEERGAIRRFRWLSGLPLEGP